MNILLRFACNALAVLAAAYIVPGISVSTIWVALVAAIVIGIVNALIRPICIVLTLPINILTLGIFTLVVNALMFWLTAYLVRGFEVSNFTAAFFGAIVFWIVSWFTNSLIGAEPARRT
jgi:putative membrane protein